MQLILLVLLVLRMASCDVEASQEHQVFPLTIRQLQQGLHGHQESRWCTRDLTLFKVHVQLILLMLLVQHAAPCDMQVSQEHEVFPLTIRQLQKGLQYNKS